jgi:hypothetical protein
MRKTLIASTIIFSLLSITLPAQDIKVPTNAVLEKAEDYEKYEKDVIACAKWLESTPLDEQKDKRKQVNYFLTKWITGSPTVTIELNSNIIEWNKSNPELLSVFMAGWTKFMLEHKEMNKDMVRGNVEGLRSVLKVYKLGKGVKKDKKLEKLIALESKGKLENWVEDQLKK